MEDLSEPIVEEISTFKRASSKEPTEFSFMKRQVRVNAVDKEVKEYQCD